MKDLQQKLYDISCMADRILVLFEDKKPNTTKIKSLMGDILEVADLVNEFKKYSK